MKVQEYEHPYIAISGPMGIGKTTAGRIIANELGFHFIEEKFANNPFVADATKDPSRHAFHSEVFFLMEKFPKIIDAEKDRTENGVVVDTPIEQDVYSYGRALLRGSEWELYHNLFLALEPQLMKPSLIACLEASAMENLRRIHERGRDFETKVTPDYLKRLTELNYEWIKNSGIPAVFIQTDHMDIVQSADAQKRMIDIIRNHL
jgi:deoxyadenosine/deoxycytidine kinase